MLHTPKNSLIHLIIFDCDGVLVDTENLAATVFSQELKKIHIPLSSGDCLKYFRGLRLEACLEKISQELGFQLPNNFKTLLDQATMSAFKNQVTPINGIPNLLSQLTENNIPFCLASNGGHEKIRTSLHSSAMTHFFPEHNIFSAEDVAHGKPHPDLFLYAAKTLAVAPEHALVIEDSLAGLTAAKAAGMKAIHFDIENDAFNTPDICVNQHATTVEELINALQQYVPLP